MRYDFVDHHGAGGNDHSDAVVRQYPEVMVQRVEDVPSHMEVDGASGMLYIADTGGQRILRVDTQSGSHLAEYSETGECEEPNEEVCTPVDTESADLEDCEGEIICDPHDPEEECECMSCECVRRVPTTEWADYFQDTWSAHRETTQEYSIVEGVSVEVFAENGLLMPSGLAIHEDRVFVSDHGTGEIIAYQKTDGQELARYQTDACGIMGLTVGPEGRIWYVDGVGNELMLLDTTEDL